MYFRRTAWTCYHDIEALSSEPQQLAVLHACPAAFRHRLDLVSRELLQRSDRKLPGNRWKIVEELFQRVPTLDVAMSAWTGTRVPTNTGVLPRMPGSEWTTEERFTDASLAIAGVRPGIGL